MIKIYSIITYSVFLTPSLCLILPHCILITNHYYWDANINPCSAGSSLVTIEERQFFSVPIRLQGLFHYFHTLPVELSLLMKQFRYGTTRIRIPGLPHLVVSNYTSISRMFNSMFQSPHPKKIKNKNFHHFFYSSLTQFIIQNIKLSCCKF